MDENNTQVEIADDDRYCSRCGAILNPSEGDPCDWCRAQED